MKAIITVIDEVSGEKIVENQIIRCETIEHRDYMDVYRFDFCVAKSISPDVVIVPAKTIK